MRTTIKQFLAVVVVVAAQGCSSCIKTSCSSDSECDAETTCQDGLCKTRPTTSSSSSSSSSSGVVSSSSAAGGTSSRGSSGAGSSGVSGGSSRSSSGIVSSSTPGSSSASVTSSSRQPICPTDCRVPGVDAGNISGYTCAGGATTLAACTPTCAAGWEKCGQGGCYVNLGNDPNNCGACGQGLGSDGGANVCGDGGPACLFNTTQVAVCGSTNPYCKEDEGCVGCTRDSQCGPSQVCCGNTCVGQDTACGCNLDNAAIPGQTCTANTGGECIVLSTGRPVATKEEIHVAACGCDFMTVSPVALTICNAVSGFLGLCAPPATGNVGLCAAQNAPARDGGFPAENCGARGNTCDPLKGGLSCIQDGGGVGKCSCDNAVDSPSCTIPVTDALGRRHVVADVCVPSTNNCGCSANGNLACGKTDAGPDCCPMGCFDLRGDNNNCGACGVQCTGGTANDGCHPIRPDAGLDIYACGCNAAGQCGTTANDCIGDFCVCRLFIDGDGGVLAGCPVGSFCCDVVARPGGGNDIGCCDLACGSSANNRCRRFAGGPSQ